MKSKEVDGLIMTDKGYIESKLVVRCEINDIGKSFSIAAEQKGLNLMFMVPLQAVTEVVEEQKRKGLNNG